MCVKSDYAEENKYIKNSNKLIIRSKYGEKFEQSLFDLENCQVSLNSLSSRAGKGWLTFDSGAIKSQLAGTGSSVNKGKMETVFSPRFFSLPV